MRGSVLRTVALMRKEMIQVWRDGRTLLLILFLPFVQMLLFAYAVRLTVDLEKDDYKRLEEIAREQETSMATLVREAVSRYLARRKRK